MFLFAWLWWFSPFGRMGYSAPRMSSGQVCALPSPLIALRKAPHPPALSVQLRDARTPTTRSGWAARGARRSEVKEEGRAQPGLGDTSGDGRPAPSSREAREAATHIAGAPTWAP
jgi:hypothetical protein